MSVAAYKAKFYALYHYATQMLTIEKERILPIIKGLNYDLQVCLCILFLHMGSIKFLTMCKS